MTTALTPRLQRSIDYATQEIFTVLPDTIPALMADVTRLRNDDTPELDILHFLFGSVNLALVLNEMDMHLQEVLDSLPQGPVH